MAKEKNALNKNQIDKNQDDLTQKALVGIKRMLFHNEIVAGQKLHFQDLAKKMNMSPTPVVQALKFLEFQGLASRKPNKGYYIAPLSIEEVEEIYKFRELLEVSLVDETIEQLDAAAIQILKTSYDAYLEALNGVFINEKLLKDMEFHITLASISNQHMRIQALKNTFDILHLKYRMSLQYVTSERSDETEHGKIFEAVINKDSALAGKYLSAHISHSRKHAVRNLRRMMEEKKDFPLYHL